MDDKEHVEAVKALVEKYKDCFDKDISHRYCYEIMRFHVVSLIEQAESFQKIKDRWVEIELDGDYEEASDFYNDVHNILRVYERRKEDD